jgi:hypothetical protein
MISDFDVTLLYAALDEKRESLGLSWSGVAKEIEHNYAKVAVSTIKGIREKGSVEGDGCLQMFLWLGRSPESFVPGLVADKCCDLEEPSNGVLRFDVPKVYRLLDAQRREEDLTWGQMAEMIDGFTAQMLKGFEKGRRTSFPKIMRITILLDVPVKELTMVSSW